MVVIKEKRKLAALIFSYQFEKIVFWEDGTWDSVPITYLYKLVNYSFRVHPKYDIDLVTFPKLKTIREVQREIKKIEEIINVKEEMFYL